MKEGHDMTRDDNNMPQEEVDDKFNRLMIIELLAAQPWWKCPMRCQVCGRPFDLIGDWFGDRHDGYITSLTCPDCATPECIEQSRRFDATHEYVEKPTGQLWAVPRDRQD